jgi:hypothetical protein
MDRPMHCIKSKRRVADHGEVFTPAWMVEAMLDLVKDETERLNLSQGGIYMKCYSDSAGFTLVLV